MNRDNLDLAAEQLEKYLNLAQEFTDDYYLTMRLGKDPMEIISRKNEKLKRIESMIFDCNELLKFTDHEITYNHIGFQVEILNPKVPF